MWKSSAKIWIHVQLHHCVTAELPLKVGVLLMCFIDVIEVSDIYASILHHVSPVLNKSTTLQTMGCNHNKIIFMGLSCHAYFLDCVIETMVQYLYIVTRNEINYTLYLLLLYLTSACMHQTKQTTFWQWICT